MKPLLRLPTNKWRTVARQKREEPSKGWKKKENKGKKEISKEDKVCLLDTNNLETPLHFFRELLHIISISSWHNHSLDTST